ncbi:MAG: hypothetical protein RMK52_07450 [Chitinophagales bacterium]|nr:hypothetical protein [Chitinophagales bacterium]MDW8394063.1 hypothetical protein [Chitinophagales bacterium]
MREAIRKIEKEELDRYRFVNYEVLDSETEIRNRQRLLEEAMLLGNGERQKVRLIMETTEGPVMVETTVWETSDSHIELKGGRDIPVCCIREVIL